MEGFDIMGMLPLVLIFIVMYFLIIRPQNKKSKQHKEMLAHLKKGDRIITNGGLIGHIHNLEEDEVVVRVSADVQVRVARSMIATVMLVDTKKSSKEKSEKIRKSSKSVKAGK